MSVHGHVPDRPFVHAWIPVCAVTAGLPSSLSPAEEGPLMSTQCGWVMLKYGCTKTKIMGSSRAPGNRVELLC